MVCVAETWLNDIINTNELIFQDFNYYRLDRGYKRGGGLLILIKKHIISDYVNSVSLPYIELLQVHIKVNNFSIINIILIYRPPNGSFNDFISFLEDFFNNLDMFRNPYVVIGDFNVDVLKKNANSNYLIDLFKSFNLHSKNILPTRIGKSCSSLIDLVFYNDTLKAIDNLVTNHDINFTDHNAIVCSFNKIKPTENDKSFIHFRSYKKFLNNNISTTTNNIIYDCYTFKDLITAINSSLDNLAPLKKREVNKIKNNFWIDKRIRNIINDKKKAYINLRNCKDNNHIDNLKLIYKEKKRICSKEILFAKSEFFRKIINNSIHNPKQMWSHIKVLFPNKDNNNNKTNNNFLNINPNNFNSFFINVALDDSPINFEDLNKTICNKLSDNITFNFEVINSEIVYKNINKLNKKSTGHNGIPFKFINIFKDAFIISITNK